jgi:two-component system, sporulation sensor kinase B
MLLVILIIVFLWTITICLLFSKLEKKTNIWYGLFLFCLSLGYFVALIKDLLVPVYHLPLSFLGRFLSAFGYRLCPYLLLMSGISYSDSISRRVKKILAIYILPIPVIISFGLDFIFVDKGFLSIYIAHSLLFIATVIWAVPYGIVGNLFFLHNFIVEKNKKLKKFKLFVVLINLPTLAMILISYCSIILNISSQMWVFNTWFALGLSSIFSFIIIKYGIFGIRVRIEKDNLENTMGIVVSGASVLIHTLKNHIALIGMNIESIQYYNKDSKINEITQEILGSTNFLKEIIKKMQKQTDLSDVIMEKKLNNLSAIIEQSIFLNAEKIMEDGIQIIKEYCNEIYLMCDETYICEAINNIIKNSIEAMEQTSEKRIKINITETKRNIILTISDNGKGILKENLPYIFNPFFSTKKNKDNFGLGLTYCYNVSLKHHASFVIKSYPDVETSVVISFKI